MKVELDLDKRLYNDIFLMCNSEENTMKEYLIECISDSFYTLKYGDLNEKLGINKEEAPKVEEKPKEVAEKKKVGRPRKKKVETESPTLVTETIEKGPNPPIMINSWEEFDKVYLNKKEENKEQPKITSRKRTLKVK